MDLIGSLFLPPVSTGSGRGKTHIYQNNSIGSIASSQMATQYLPCPDVSITSFADCFFGGLYLVSFHIASVRFATI